MVAFPGTFLLAAAAPSSGNDVSWNGVELWGVRLVGFNPELGKKLILSLGLVCGIVAIRYLFTSVTRLVTGGNRNNQIVFWIKQGVRLVLAAVLIGGFISIWFSDPTRMTTFLGLVTAGIAFALQRVITAIAGYFIILRGRTFNVGDRIVMGGVRGDVMDLGFFQTRIMEMGQPPGEQKDDPSMWVKSRQYTGRIVTLTNDKIFDTPVYNYTLDFPFLWDEMTIPITYKGDRARAERILLEAAQKHTCKISEMSEEAIAWLERRYVIERSSIKPRVYWRLTDNWLELTVRFVVGDHHAREIKDAMSRDILHAFNGAGLEIASGTYEIVGMPALNVRVEPRVAVGGTD